MTKEKSTDRDPHLTPEQAYERLEHFLKFHHPGVSPDDLELTSTRGYWQMKAPCAGAGRCASPLHTFLGNADGCQHTIAFAEHGKREGGRFVRPFRVWEALSQVPELA